MTLQEFVEEAGSVEKASQKIGCSMQSVARWLKGERRPGYMATERLKSMGIKL